MKQFGAVLLGLSASSVLARCPNDCSYHGECNPSSICECYHGYVGNDCSQRMCTYAKAYTDTPLGDLNANEVFDVDQQVFMHHSNSPVGEMYPPHYGLARTANNESWNEAHFYRECANKGLCDRKSGQCDCFPGFEGEGCQRTSCPSDCNGHGQCVLTSYDTALYDAWDFDVTQGCLCDPGYTGADCSKRECPGGADPEETKYVDTSTLFKIEFSQLGDKGNGIEFYDGTTMMPNGQVLFTLTLRDEFGDEFTTPASTIWYQADCDDNSNRFQPDTTTASTECLSSAFPVNPYGHNEDQLRSIRDPENLLDLYQNTSVLYESSFVGEHLNNSLNALPSSAARGSLVWVAANTVFGGSTSDLSFLYPSRYGPDFQALGAAAASQDASVCNQDTSEHNGMCNTQLDFSVGPTPFLNTPKFRFPIFYENADVSGEGFVDAARRYLNCAEGSLCIFVRLEGPVNGRALTARYKYKSDIYVANRTTDFGTEPAFVGVSDPASAADYVVFSGPEMTGWSRFESNSTGPGTTTASTGAIVEVSEVGSDRKWHTGLDGSPEVTYNSGQTPHTCSKRGLCDYDTGLCNCFEGYHGAACGTRQ